ncbi:MAG: YebC/PmpR family DNA-binding transcriptional regulator [candidate division WOR-3 bacterium]
MSGHNKWSTIKRKKAVEDNKRGQIFTKLIKEITLAAREGGGDPELNARLRAAIAAAKKANMPADNIDRAIKKGTGELPGTTYEEVVYGGYGPGGAAILIDVVTDNKNRTTGELRHIFTRFGKELGDVSSVSWMFEKKGLIEIDGNKYKFDDIMEIAIDAGGEDVVTTGDVIQVYTAPEDLYKVKKVFDDKKIETTNVTLTKKAQSTVQLNENDASVMLKLIDALEDHDDVQNVYSNFDISDELMEKLSK